jgi:heme-degrading monooxygenase HmoA
MGYYPPEMSKEDIKEYERLTRLYYSFSDEERRFIVTEWDSQNGLENWQTRLERKNNKSKIERRNTVIGIIIVILVFGLLFYFVPKYNEGQYAKKKLNYIYEVAKENVNLKRYLKAIDQELDDLRALVDEFYDY